MAKKPGNWARALGDALSMATSFAAAVAIGYFSGHWLDGKLKTGYTFTLIFLLLGVATGLKLMYDMLFGRGRRNIERILKEDEEQETVRDYRPSKEMIDALNEAKKMLAGLEIKDREPADREDAKNAKKMKEDEEN